MIGLKMNKLGGKILSVYWFAILVIVAVGVIAMVFVFYGKPYDVRKAEGEILINKIADCLSSDDGKLKQISNLDECHLNFGEKNEFYIEVGGLGIKQGNFNLKDDCGKAVNLVCVEKNVYYLNEDGSERIIKFLSVVGKNG